MNCSDAADDKNAGGANYDRLLNYFGEPIHHTQSHLTIGQGRTSTRTPLRACSGSVPDGENRNGMPGPKLYRVFTGP